MEHVLVKWWIWEIDLYPFPQKTEIDGDIPPMATHPRQEYWGGME
jgi:hypothetical protein